MDRGHPSSLSSECHIATSEKQHIAHPIARSTQIRELSFDVRTKENKQQGSSGRALYIYLANSSSRTALYHAPPLRRHLPGLSIPQILENTNLVCTSIFGSTPDQRAIGRLFLLPTRPNHQLLCLKIRKLSGAAQRYDIIACRTEHRHVDTPRIYESTVSLVRPF